MNATTPPPTRIALVVTLAATALLLVGAEMRRGDGRLTQPVLGAVLAALTILFLVRVVGQLVVAIRHPRWLPPMNDWNLTPYRLLLPAQILILAVMTWVDVSFIAESGPPTRASGRFGWAVTGFSSLYACSMIVRYVVRMARRPETRWFGGTIPIVFHEVLATYLFLLGSFHAGR